jgi:sugar phosphate isomerase/epimerase
MFLRRREFFAAALATPALLRGGSAGFAFSRVAMLTDEIARNPADAIAFCTKYGIRNVEVRSVPGGGGHYGLMPEDKLREAVKQFRDNGLKVTFLNTPFFKTTLPGTEPVLRRPETPENREKRLARHQAEFDRRRQDFQTAFRNAHILGTDKMRVFTFLRVAEPESVFGRTAEVIGEMATLAAKEGIRLAVENEGACNVVTCSEIAGFLKLIPQKNVGINWDPMNGMSREKPYPNGYALLPKHRIWNVQFKGKSLLEPNLKLDWGAILGALVKDGYKGFAGLETHYLDGTDPEKAHLCVAEIKRILES